MDLTGIARIPLGMLDYAARRGCDRAELLREAGLHEDVLREPDRRIPASRIVSLWHALVARLPDPALGIHIASDIDLRRWGLVGYVMAHSPTLERALRRFERYGRILTETLRVHLAGGELRIDSEPQLVALRHPIDARLALIVGAARQIAGADLDPSAIRLPYPRPVDTSAHARWFRCPLQFGAEHAAVVFSPQDLGREVSTADETLASYLNRLAEVVLKSLSAGDSFVTRVRRALWSDLSEGRPSLARSARTLGTSPRTLQRRLDQEGTTFARVLDAFRREMAAGLLRDPELSVSETAFLLGYSETSAFHRAFRRWYGTSPRDFRRKTA